MQLIILAAGYGGRLSPATEVTPKALLDLGGGVTILDRQLEAAKACGITKVSVVVGFQAEKIEAKLKDRSDLGLEFCVLYNPFYRTTNNLVSLWTARSAMVSDFILINGDNIFKPSILRHLSNEPSRFAAVISRKKSYDEDDTKLAVHHQKILKLAKDLPINETNAEWIGMCLVRGDMIPQFVKKLDDTIRIPRLLDGPPHYLSVFQGLADDGTPLEAIEISSDDWAEIDYQMDLQFVRSHMTRFAD